MKTLSLLAGMAALFAVPALAQEAHAGHQEKDAAKMAPPEMARPEMTRPEMTRADVTTRVKAMLAEMDRDKDGAVTRAEMDAHRAAQHKAMQDRMFTAMDSDKDGQISRAEFDAHHKNMGAHPMPMSEGDMSPGMAMGAGMHSHGDAPQKRRILILRNAGPEGARPMMGMEGMFDRADANKDGKVTESEALSAALARFDRADANKDGKISANERPQRRMKIRKVIEERQAD